MTKFSSPALDRVAKGDLCAGCGACAALAPAAVSMRMTPPGYLRPYQTADIDAATNDAIAAVCPGLGQTVTADSRTDDPLWGPYVAMFQGHSADPKTRFAGASGGALTALARYLVDTGRVDAVVTIMADDDNPTGNKIVQVSDPDSILQTAGSRYAPSTPLADIGAILDQQARTYAFIGKPCDVAALRAMEARDPRIARRIPIKMSFFCAGVPSQSGAEAVVRALDADPDDITSFRYRGNGWPGQATVQRMDGSTQSMSYNDSWGNILADHVQFRCKVCADGTGAAADIVSADAWQCDDRGYPLFDERPGVSLMVARTQLGADILAQAQDANAVVLSPFDVAGLAQMQPGQFGRKRVLAARLAALAVLGRPAPKYRGMHIFAATRFAPFKTLLRNFAGTAKRVLRSK